jgi:uncharacterized protein YaaW (UPF0174 family)
MPELPLIGDDHDLVLLVRSANNDMLAPLVGYITDNGKGRVSSKLDGLDSFERNYSSGNHRAYADEIASEIQTFGGNSIVSFFRGGKGVRYKEVVEDVASKLGADCKDDSVSVIEQQILLKILDKAWEKMSEAQRRELLETAGLSHGTIPRALPLAAMQAAVQASGFVAYKLAVIVANAVARALLGHGLSLAANAALTKSISILSGPIGWAITAIWAAIDIASPAYRVTIPCVVHVATIRLANTYGSSTDSRTSSSDGHVCRLCGASCGASSDTPYCHDCSSFIGSNQKATASQGAAASAKSGGVAGGAHVCNLCGASWNTPYCHDCSSFISANQKAKATSATSAGVPGGAHVCKGCGTRWDTPYCHNCSRMT